MSHIMVWRGAGQEDGLAGFWHHGILCPDGTVIHYSGMDGVKSLRNAAIMRTSLSNFDGDAGRPVHTVTYETSEHPRIYAHADVVRRAESRLGHQQYHVLFDNCESFARWCVVGSEISFQGQGVVVGVAAGVGSLVFGGGLLGAALTAVVVHKFWDRRANTSSGRERTGSGESDRDSEHEFSS